MSSDYNVAESSCSIINSPEKLVKLASIVLAMGLFTILPNSLLGQVVGLMPILPGKAGVELPRSANINRTMFLDISLSQGQRDSIAILADQFSRRRAALLSNMPTHTANARMTAFFEEQRVAYRNVLSETQKSTYDRNTAIIMRAWAKRYNDPVRRLAPLSIDLQTSRSDSTLPAFSGITKSLIAGIRLDSGQKASIAELDSLFAKEQELLWDQYNPPELLSDQLAERIRNSYQRQIDAYKAILIDGQTVRYNRNASNLARSLSLLLRELEAPHSKK